MASSFSATLAPEVEITVDPDDGPVSFDGAPVEDTAPEIVEAVREGLGPRAPWAAAH